MEDLNDKMTGDELSAAEFVQPMSEIQNIIEQSGQTLTSADVAQMLKGLTYFTTASPHFTATADGSGDLTLAPLAGRGTIYSIADGMRVRFLTTAAAVVTGAPSLTINGVTKDFRKRDGSALSTGTYAAGVWSAAEYDAGNDRWFSVEAGVGAGHGEVILAETEDLMEHADAAGKGARVLTVKAWKDQKKRQLVSSNFVLPDNGGGAPIVTDVTPLTVTLDVPSGLLTNSYYRIVYDLLTEGVSPTVANDITLSFDFGTLTQDVKRFQVSTDMVNSTGISSPTAPESVRRSVDTSAGFTGAFTFDFYRETNGEVVGAFRRRWKIELIVNATGQPLVLQVANGNTTTDGEILPGSQVTAELIS